MAELLTVDDVAKQLGFKRDFVWKLARDEKIDVLIIGGRYRFTQEAIDKFIAKHTLPTKDANNAN